MRGDAEDKLRREVWEGKALVQSEGVELGRDTGPKILDVVKDLETGEGGLLKLHWVRSCLDAGRRERLII